MADLNQDAQKAEAAVKADAAVAQSWLSQHRKLVAYAVVAVVVLMVLAWVV